jgi:photosystem II stability/assembly factor-like uncharacterized protein
MEDFVFQLAVFENGKGAGSTYFAARQSGLFCSEDEGNTWHSLYDSLNLSSPLPTMALALICSSQQPPLLFAGIGGNVLYSQDKGNSWRYGRMPSSPPVISAMAVSPDVQRDGILFAATLENGVLFSSDCGNSWTSWNFGLLDMNTLCLAISPDFAVDETIFVGTQSGLFRSNNGGRAWREIELPVEYDAVLSLAISARYKENGIVFAGTETKGLLRSSDFGETWRQVGNDVLSEPINSILLSTEMADLPEILILHGGVPVRSIDGGDTWLPWREKQLNEAKVTSILAPSGFDKPVLVGLTDGKILHV